MDKLSEETYADFELHQFSSNTIVHQNAIISFKPNGQDIYIHLNSLEILFENNVESFKEIKTYNDSLKKVEINFCQKQDYPKLILSFHTSSINGKITEAKWNSIINFIKDAKDGKYLVDHAIINRNKSMKERHNDSVKKAVRPFVLDNTITLAKLRNKKSTTTSKTVGDISPIKQKFESITTTSTNTSNTNSTITSPLLSAADTEPIEMVEDLPPIKSRLITAAIESNKLNKEVEKSDDNNNNHNANDNQNNDSTGCNNFKKFKSSAATATATTTSSTENIFDHTTDTQIKKTPIEVKYQPPNKRNKKLEDKKREEKDFLNNEINGKHDNEIMEWGNHQSNDDNNSNFSSGNDDTPTKSATNNNNNSSFGSKFDRTKKRDRDDQEGPHSNVVRTVLPPTINGNKKSTSSTSSSALFASSNYKSGTGNNSLVNTYTKTETVGDFDFGNYNQNDICGINLGFDYDEDDTDTIDDTDHFSNIYINNNGSSSTKFQSAYTNSAFSSNYGAISDNYEDDIFGGGSSNNSYTTSNEIFLLKHKGLFNLGNTCYMNVILQSLFGINKLYRDIKSAQTHSFETNIDIYNLLMQVWEAIKTTDQDYYFSSLKSFRSKYGDICVDPKLLKLSIDKLTPMFKGYRQHDAHEFLVSFLDVLEEALKSFFVKKIGIEKQLSQTTKNEITINNDTLLKFAEEVNNITDMNICSQSSNGGGDKDSDKDSEDDEKEKQMEIEKLKVEKSIQDKEFKETINMMVEDYCPIKNNFKSSITNIFQCCNCDDIQYSVEVFNDISLNVPKTTPPLSSNYLGSGNKSVKLDTLVEQYLKEEVIERKCSKCKHEKSKILKAFKTTSDILVLHLKRFQMDSTGKRLLKIESFVEPLDSITLNQYDIIIPESNNNDEEEIEKVKETSTTNIDKKIDKKIDQEQIDNNNSVNNNNNNVNNNKKEEKEVKKIEETTSTTTTTPVKPNNNLLNEIIRKSNRKTVKYSLQSIVVHSGTVDSGHYTCCMNVNNSWKQFDDSHVTFIDKSTVLSKTKAYIFFYIKNNSS